MLHIVLLLCSLLQHAGACTVLELTGAGFAANAVHVFHAYTLFAQNNGTIYLDSSAFEYKCAGEGGWQEFFSFDAAQGRLASYSPEVEQRESCARYTFHDIDIMLHTMHYDWFSIDVDAAKQARVMEPARGIAAAMTCMLKVQHTTRRCSPCAGVGLQRVGAAAAGP